MSKNISSFELSRSIYSLINTNRMVDLFLEIVKIDTTSCQNTWQLPSSKGQIQLAKILKSKLDALGMDEVNIYPENGYVVVAKLSHNIKDKTNLPTIGLLAHLDTSYDSPGANVKPLIHKKYIGGSIKLPLDNTIIPESDLLNHIGDDIITSDGSTLLGADDKAGIAEIIEVVSVLIENPQIPRPNIKIAFTPDEEIGEFIQYFDLSKFKVDVAYTLDAKDGHYLDISTFNAINVDVLITGYNVHTGESKNKLVNAIRMANYFINLLPEFDIPECSNDDEGFIHLSKVESQPAIAKINLLLRDFDFDKVLNRLELVKKIATKTENKFKEKFPDYSDLINIDVKSKILYKNPREYIDKVPLIKLNAFEGIKRTLVSLGKDPSVIKETSIRGGTDGSTLTMKGIPTANFGAGWHNAHAKNEFISVQKMQECCASIINTLIVWSETVN